MSNTKMEDGLNKLGYNSQWLDFGVLDRDLLEAQKKRYASGEDLNTEHYRYQTLIQYLDCHSELSDSEFHNLLNLIRMDDDAVMALSVLINMYSKLYLTDEQFEILCRETESYGDGAKRVVTRQKLLRKMRTEGLTPSLFEDGIRSNDKVVQEFMIGIADFLQLQILSEKGRNKKIRTEALQRMKKLKKG